MATLLPQRVGDVEARAPEDGLVGRSQVVVLGQVVEVAELEPRVVPAEAEVVVRLDPEPRRVDGGEGVDADAEVDLRGRRRLTKYSE